MSTSTSLLEKALMAYLGSHMAFCPLGDLRGQSHLKSRGK
jgi:hypothetical protein